MNNQDHEKELKALEDKLETLLKHCNKLQDENISLKLKQEDLIREKAGLIEKTSLAKSRVEEMINRLKTMEHT